jgi:hypothetical protein
MPAPARGAPVRAYCGSLGESVAAFAQPASAPASANNMSQYQCIARSSDREQTIDARIYSAASTMVLRA